jgi:hypothetical protein
MLLDDVLQLLITTVVTLAVVTLVAGIFVINGYAAVHAWRSGRRIWAIAIVGLFLSGGWIATAAYLWWYRDEPLPPSPRRRRALA